MRSPLLAATRFWWLVVLAALVGAGVAGLTSAAGVGTVSTGTATYIVGLGTSGADSLLPPYDAEVQARTAAVVISGDGTLRENIAAQSGLPRSLLSTGVSASQVVSTRVVEVTFKASTSDAIVSYFGALTPILEASGTPALGGARLHLLDGPSVQGGGGLALSAVIGGAGGALAGLVGAVMLARARLQVSSAGRLQSLVGTAVLDVPVMEASGDAALLVSEAIARMTAPGARVAVVAGTGVNDSVAEAVAGRLARASVGAVAQARLHVIAYGSLDTAAARLGSQASDITLLLVTDRARVSQIARDIEKWRGSAASQLVVGVARRDWVLRHPNEAPGSRHGSAANIPLA